MKKNITKLFILCLIMFQIPIMVFIWHPYQTKKDLDIITIPVASHELSFREKIEVKDIEWINIPSKFISDEIITHDEDLIDHVVSNYSIISKGSFFLYDCVDNASLIQDQNIQELNHGQTAFSFNVDLIQVAGNTLVENQKIDIYCLIQKRDEFPIVDMLLEAVRIIDIRDRTGLKLTDENSTGIASVLTIALNQEYIPLLVSAREIGEIQIYANDESWNTNHECILNTEGKIIPLLNPTEISE